MPITNEMQPETGQQNNIGDAPVINTDQLETATPNISLPDAPGNTFSPFNIQDFLQPTAQEGQDQQEVSQLQQQSGGLLSQIAQQFQRLAGKGERTIELEQQQDIAGLSTAATEAQNELMQFQLQARRQEEALLTQPGLTKGQLNARLQDVQRKNRQQEADLQIIQMAASNRLENAQSIVDRKVELEFMDEQARMDGLRFIYDENKEILSDKEDKLFQKTLQREQRAFDLARDEYKAVEDTKASLVQNAAQRGAGNSTLQAIMSSGSIYDAYKNAGKYAVTLDTLVKNKQLTKLSNEIKAQNQPLNIPSVAGSSNEFVAKLLNSAVNDKHLAQGEREQLGKMKLVVDQLDILEQSISGSNKTGLFGGRVNKLLGNLGADAEAGSINAQLQALVPNVARGVYGEVGVLTDADIRNYKKTLPRLNAIEDQNDLVLAMTLRNAAKSYENVLNSAANSGINVSGWAQDYSNIIEQANEIEDRIGVTTSRVETFVEDNPDLQPMVEELIILGATDREILTILGI